VIVVVSEKVLIDEYAHNYVTWGELKQYMDESDIHFVMNEEDPKPYRHFKKFYHIARVFRPIYEAKERKKALEAEAARVEAEAEASEAAGGE